MDDIKVGDEVEVINYGHIEWSNDECEVILKDSKPNLIGQKGKVEIIKLGKYGISGIIGKYYPFNKDQLKKL